MAKVICDCGQVVSLSKQHTGRCKRCDATFSLKIRKAPSLAERRSARRKREAAHGSVRTLFVRFVGVAIFLGVIATLMASSGG